jgi:hypothetical protein
LVYKGDQTIQVQPSVPQASRLNSPSLSRTSDPEPGPSLYATVALGMGDQGGVAEGVGQVSAADGGSDGAADDSGQGAAAEQTDEDTWLWTCTSWCASRTTPMQVRQSTQENKRVEMISSWMLRPPRAQTDPPCCRRPRKPRRHCHSGCCTYPLPPLLHAAQARWPSPSHRPSTISIASWGASCS